MGLFCLQPDLHIAWHILIDPNNTRQYYYNNNWQVLCEYDGSGSTVKAWYMYGNYIDEVLIRYVGSIYLYAHDHLYSPAALVNYTDGSVLERCEYDAYGKATIRDAQYAIRDTSLYDNPYYFTGRRVDFLDNGSLKIQYSRNRYYDYYTGRFTTHDPLGITPNPPAPNRFGPTAQYTNGLSLYEYVKSNPIDRMDSYGLVSCEWSGFSIIDLKFKPAEPIGDGFSIPGRTTPDPWYFLAETGNERCKECRGCPGVRVIMNAWGVKFWWSTYKSYDHERMHAKLFKRYWAFLESQINSVPDKCMKKRKSACYVKALYKFRYAYEVGAWAANYAWDCADYEPGKYKDLKCKMSRKKSKEYNRKINKAYSQLRKCQRME